MEQTPGEENTVPGKQSAGARRGTEVRGDSAKQICSVSSPTHAQLLLPLGFNIVLLLLYAELRPSVPRGSSFLSEKTVLDVTAGLTETGSTISHYSSWKGMTY